MLIVSILPLLGRLATGNKDLRLPDRHGASRDFNSFDHNLTIALHGLLRLSRRPMFARTQRRCRGDAHLLRLQLQGGDTGRSIAPAARMGHSPQSSPDNHVPRGTDLGAGVDIPQNHHRAPVLQAIPGAQATFVEGCLFLVAPGLLRGLLLGRRRWHLKLGRNPHGNASHNCARLNGAQRNQVQVMHQQQFLQLFQIRATQQPVPAIQFQGVLLTETWQGGFHKPQQNRTPGTDP